MEEWEREQERHLKMMRRDQEKTRIAQLIKKKSRKGKRDESEDDSEQMREKLLKEFEKEDEEYLR